MIFDEIKSIGNNSGKGNIIGIQPYLTSESYESGESFQNTLDTYLSHLQSSGFLNENTVVVFPEHIGTWLVFSEEKKDFIFKKSLDELVEGIYQAYPTEFQTFVEKSDKQLKELEAAFHVKAKTIAELYQTTFSNLSKKYKVHVIGGSVVLENPSVEDKTLVCKPGPLYNVSVVFNPDGSLNPHITKKIHLVHMELGFLSSGSVAEQYIYDLPIGKLCLLICADCWYSDTYNIAIKDVADIIAVPSYQNENDLWDKEWRGYSVDSAEDVYDKNDIGKITEGDAWKKYALHEKIKKTKAKIGINVFLKGSLWDMGANSGHTVLINGDNYGEISTNKAGFMNIWL